MPSFKYSVDITRLRRKWTAASNALLRATDVAALVAAKEGVDAAKQQHPYTDRTWRLTRTARAGSFRQLGVGAYMVWPMSYARFVNYGTSRSAAYPFLPIARAAANKRMKAEMRRILREFKSAFDAS